MKNKNIQDLSYIETATKYRAGFPAKIDIEAKIRQQQAGRCISTNSVSNINISIDVNNIKQFTFLLISDLELRPLSCASCGCETFVIYIMANEVSIDSVDNAPFGRPNIKVKTKY